MVINLNRAQLTDHEIQIIREKESRSIKSPLANSQQSPVQYYTITLRFAVVLAARLGVQAAATIPTALSMLQLKKVVVRTQKNSKDLKRGKQKPHHQKRRPISTSSEK